MFRRTLDLYRSKLSGKHLVQFLIALDDDDQTMKAADVRAYLDGCENLTYRYGTHRSKVEAINSFVGEYEWDIVVLASDDMIPRVSGYDDVIVRAMMKHFPELDGVLHYYDGQRDDLNTGVFMGRKLYDQWGYLYHPDYLGFYCDNELHAVTTGAGKSVYIPDVILLHDWVGMQGGDDLFQRNQVSFERDKQMFQLRQARGFPKGSIVQKSSLPIASGA